MSAFVEILVTAFVAQLLALPGEKGQLVIASLATRYNPYMVVAGAATAFGGWTAVEILLGNALKGALPVAALDAVTAGLFVVFAAWLLYGSLGAGDSTDRGGSERTPSGAAADAGPVAPGSATTDGGATAVDSTRSSHLDSHVSPAYRGFVPAFSMMVVGEFGDKTQLVTIGLAAQYGASAAIWAGEMLAIVPVSLATALVVDRSAARLDGGWLHRVAAAVFLVFALDIAAEYVVGVSLLPI
ncbi:TMEM165/GDT1 family protein [Halovivax cerinus]|uniref:TMEM165/GDT1 family protein n=1 Tax=Halovivax cerinus TaxID=1487865 RepID=A0ABD5NJF4_9EURY|nr:TMEM165/GDT1 family protein [Halovivax cerinus]